MLARAFACDRAEAASDVLDAFTDTASMTAEQKQAAAALVAAGGRQRRHRNHACAVRRADPRAVQTMLLRIVPLLPD